MRARISRAFAAMLSVVLLSSCSSLTVDLVPLPGQSNQGGYDIVLEFASVLNLPDRAKVVMDGTKVGVVREITLTARGVDVTVGIDDNVAVPSSARAVLQQATVLGDTYVALERAGDSSAIPLPPGGRIPVAQTTSPPQLEDTLANLATFTGSGAIQRAQNTVIGINRITPARPEIREIASRAAVDLSDLANNLDNVDLWLQGIADSGQVASTYTPSFSTWFSPTGIAGFRTVFLVTHFLAPILPTIGSIYFNGYWLVPLLESLGDALETSQRVKWSVEDEWHRWLRLVTEQVLPEKRYPAINITSIVGPDGRELSGNVEQVLHMIGAMP